MGFYHQSSTQGKLQFIVSWDLIRYSMSRVQKTFYFRSNMNILSCLLCFLGLWCWMKWIFKAEIVNDWHLEYFTTDKQKSNKTKTEKFDKDVTYDTGFKVRCFYDWLTSGNRGDQCQMQVELQGLIILTCKYHNLILFQIKSVKEI